MREAAASCATPTPLYVGKFTSMGLRRKTLIDSCLSVQSLSKIPFNSGTCGPFCLSLCVGLCGLTIITKMEQHNYNDGTELTVPQ